MHKKVVQRKIVGVWQLKSLKHLYEDGTVFYPYGKKVKGRLVYTSDGFMAVLLKSASLKDFKNPGLYAGKKTEKVKAFENTIAYCGTYEIKDKAIEHTVNVSLFPNWEGSKQVRFFKFEKEKLILRSRKFELDDILQTAEVVWVPVN